MTTREQELQKIKGVISHSFGMRHVESIKEKIKQLENKKKNLIVELQEISKKEIVSPQMSFFAKNAPVLCAIAVFYLISQFAFRMGIIKVLIASAVGAVIGFLIGIFIKKGCQSSLEDVKKKNQEKHREEIKNCDGQIDTVEQEISKLQMELKVTKEDIELLKKTYLSNSELASFYKLKGAAAVEMLALYFERGRADTIQEAIELYEDEAKDKARIKKAHDELDKSLLAYTNGYIAAMKVLGRQNEYSYMEKSAKNYNEKLERENEELKEIMGKN